jgi:hypothetical protein
MTVRKENLEAARRTARSREFRDRHLAEKFPRRRNSDEPETVDEYLARGGKIEVLPAFAMNGNGVDDEDE